MSRSDPILHVINHLGAGGAERQLRELVRRSELEHEIVELHGLASSAPHQLAGLLAVLARRRPRVVAAWLDRPQIAVALAAPPGTRLVAAVRGLPGRGSRRQRPLLRAALARYDRLVTNSEAARAAVRAFAAPLLLGPFDVVPNGIELPDRAAEPPPAGGPLRVGFVGRADPAKGIDVLVGALRELGDGARGTLVGGGVPEVVRSAGLDVRAVGAVDDPWAELDGCDVLAVPSRSEGSPNVVLEAFARGVPVVGTAVGGTTALLDGGRGLLVPPGDPHALAERLRVIRDDPAAARDRATRARRYVERVHAWPRVVAAYDHLFAGLAG
jgi:glycosyltransferase involved in cell wall biosynthesis